MSETQTAQVEILKVKNGIATVIKYEGRQYTVQHPSHIRGNQNINGRSKREKRKTENPT